MSLVEHLLNPALWAALLMGVCAPLFGRHLLLGRTLLLGLALPQVSLAGVALTLYGAAVGWQWCLLVEDETARGFLGAAVLTLPALFVLARRREWGESTLAVLYLAALAGANLLLSSQVVSEASTQDLFHGRLLLLGRESFGVLAAVLVPCSAVALWKGREMALVLVDPDFAVSRGYSLRCWRAVLAFLNGLVISVAVATVGPLVTFGFLVLPVLGGAFPARSLSRHRFWASGFGIAMGLVGYALAYEYDLPLGDAVVATGCALLALVFAMSRFPGRRLCGRAPR